MATKNGAEILEPVEPVFNWQDTKLARECDLVMRGGITSGVIYPQAITEFAKSYRLRGVGGASAGAIGAAFAAAAEMGRETGGFERLHRVPESLGGDALGNLFQPQKSTRVLLRIMLAGTGNGGPKRKTPRGVPDRGPSRNRVLDVTRELCRSFPVASAVGLLPGAIAVAAALGSRSRGAKVFAIPGVALAGVGWLAAMTFRVGRKLSRELPRNQFGICTGATADGPNLGLTDWLSKTIDELAGPPGRQHPLTFGELWTKNIGQNREAEATVAGPHGDGEDIETPDEYFQTSGKAAIQLLMMTTCVTKGRAYEMPWEAKNFFYDPEVWRTLFPDDVMTALAAAPLISGTSKSKTTRYRDQEDAAKAHLPALRRLPAAEHLPVIVATRLSLSFPVLISAVPLWEIDFGRSKRKGERPGDSIWKFQSLWFTDGGLCSNFPLHMFDSALPTRPTFAINLGRFERDSDQKADESKNIRFVSSNVIPPDTYATIQPSGWPAVLQFAAAAFATTRGWSDNSRLTFPGYRDRIVQVLQTKQQGGLNLHMHDDTIKRLAERGRVGAAEMVSQFNGENYKSAGRPSTTGWDNHRWVRYRALMGTLPQFFAEFAAGYSGTPKPGDETRYPIRVKDRPVMQKLTDIVSQAAADIGALDQEILELHAGEPRPLGRLGRHPHL